MDDRLVSNATVTTALIRLGVLETLAPEVAADSRIAWTKDALRACVAYVKQGEAAKAEKPGAGSGAGSGGSVPCLR